MKVHVPDHPSRGIQRVATALRKYAPAGIECVDRESADLVVLHVAGRRDAALREIERLKRRGQRHAVVQYAVRSTLRPDTFAWSGTINWDSVWGGAVAVWSYYDLQRLCDEDCNGVRLENFYHAPLGVSDAFTNDMDVVDGTPRAWTIASIGSTWLTESLRECANAAWAVHGRILHVGQPTGHAGVETVTEIDDERLAWYLHQCHFVSGLRRIEGFELPAAEGLCCGARPVLFDRPHYRQWYHGLAEFIPETDRASVIVALTELFQRGARPVTPDERAEARRRFDWPTIIGGFWERAL